MEIKRKTIEKEIYSEAFKNALIKERESYGKERREYLEKKAKENARSLVRRKPFLARGIDKLKEMIASNIDQYNK